ncbi:hypothetical protein K8089_01050 [Aequorivita sp. F47161]|uniref:Intradiol ring-cleavage dioxygenases domain-containing protein n=1 Tax=Aequorivita vitellina TaxID=2874475 RepID=A0A9X1U0F2_9FLAO|nr:hypothetical protein [Aequorivita vitellina]MCG2417590.1 hypothetical protein [Aequorivita vitellina]
MNKTTSRRLFMRNSAIAITGLAVLTPTVSSAFANSESPYEGYNPYAETKKDLRTSIFNTNTITIKGTIYKKDGVTPLRDALVEVWHLSPNSSKYRHRTKLRTDSEGNYGFITDFPNKEKGKSSRIYFKLSDSEHSQFTELILTATGSHITGEHWEKNNHLRENLFPKQTRFMDTTTIQFNISI